MNDPLIPIPLGVEQVCSQQRGRSDSEVAELRRQGWQQSLAELQGAVKGAAEVRVLLLEITTGHFLIFQLLPGRPAVAWTCLRLISNPYTVSFTLFVQDKNNQLRLAWDSEPLMRTAFELLLHTCVTLKKGVAEAVQACRGWLAQGLKLQGPGSNAVLQRTEYVARKLCGARAHREALVVVRSVAEAYVEAGLPQ
eukprot:scaffold30417_cov28-Tisochrysis_lutea.AAC.1